jgi:Histidine kinase/Two component regulator propeller
MNYLLPIVIFLLSFNAAAQDPNYVVIDKSKGLPSNSVYNIFQDSRGFIWVATEEGLSRYDGYQFKTYFNPGQTSKAGSLISEDRYGRIWYENFDGYLYYVENDSLKVLKQNKPAGYMPYGLSENTAFISSEKGIDLYDLKTLKVRKTISIPYSDIVFAQFADQTYYVLSDTIYALNDNGIKNNYKNTAKAGKIAATGKNSIWLYEKNDLKTIYRANESGITGSFSFGGNKFVHTYSLVEDKIWFCSSSGAFALSSDGAAFENGNSFFPGKSISCVLKDREDNYWFSTTNQGLLFISDFSSRRYFTGFEPTRICINENELYFGTQSGELWKSNLNTMQPFPILQSSSHHSVDFLENGDKYYPLYLTTDTFFVIGKNQAKQKWPSSLKDCEVIAPGVYACALSGYAGLFYAAESPDNPWKHLTWGRPDSILNPVNTFGYMLVENVRAKSVAWDSLKETIYYATNKGLFAVNRNGKTEITNKAQPIFVSKHVFINNALYGLSALGEVFRIDRNGNYERLNEKFSLPDQQVKGIKKSGQYLIYYTSSGFTYLDMQSGTDIPTYVPTYTTDIYDLEIRNNTIFISAPEGILSKEIKRANPEKVNPVFILNSFLVNGIQSVVSDNYLLNYKQNNIEINYSLLSFKTGSAYPLYYRINETEWMLCSPETRSLLLAALSPGSYHIEFRFGNDTEKPMIVSNLNFTIDKPWWYKWWAIVLYAGLFVLVVAFVYQKQIEIQQRKNRMQTEKFDLENKLNRSVLTSIKSQMNPHFFYNALNTIQSFIYTNDKQNAGIYLSKFAKLTRTILEMSDQEEVSLQEEITAIRLYLELEQARFENDFEFTIDVKNGADPEHTRLPSLLLQPYIENAVKHGLLHKKGEKKLNIIFERIASNLIITIDDNGIGRQRSEELNTLRKDKPKSFSTQANQKRLDLLNQERNNLLSVQFIDKTNTNEQACGTTVIITIPIQK